MGRSTKHGLTAAALACVLGPVSAANLIDGSNREWLPLTALTNHSWEAINGVCQSAFEAPGPCSGSLGSVDLTGWTWATRTEVVGLIGEFMLLAGDGTAPAAMTGPQGYGTYDHGWAAAVIAAMGTTAAPLGSYTFGFTNGGPGDYTWLCSGGPCVWTSYAAASERYGGQSEYYGGWFYRAAPVPEPSSIALMLAGAALLRGLRGQRGKSAA